jgi:hypothetical protein
VRPHHVAAAFRALGRVPLVFGPAADGGYWLVGARRRPAPPRGLFDGVCWSTCHALADTLANAGGRRAVLLETLEDVDDAEAYRRRSRPPAGGARRRDWAGSRRDDAERRPARHQLRSERCAST